MIRRFVAMSLLVASMMGVLVIGTPTSTYAACNTRFLTFPTWYDGLTEGGECNIKSPEKVGGISNFILRIALNLLDILFQAVAYITVGYIIWGAFKYVTAYGESNEIVLARQRILNAIIGLVIAMLAVAIVNYIGHSIKS